MNIKTKNVVTIRKTCEQCGAEFDTRDKAKRFCCEQCRGKAEMARYRQKNAERLAESARNSKWSLAKKEAAALTRASIVCVDCGATFATPVRRGGKPKRCAACALTVKRSRSRVTNEKLRIGSCARCGGACTSGAKYCGDCIKSAGVWRELEDKQCVVCGGLFRPTSSKQKCCCNECAKTVRAKTLSAKSAMERTHTCKQCGKEFVAKKQGRQTFCSRDCSVAYSRSGKTPLSPVKTRNSTSYSVNSRGRKMLRKFYGDSWQEHYESVNALSIYERDGWICGICGRMIDRNAVHPAAGSATIDHIVPLAFGGEHKRSNVQAAHFGCNSTKSDSLPGVRQGYAVLERSGASVPPAPRRAR